MSLDLDLPPDLELELAAEAAQLHLPLADYAVRLLAGNTRPDIKSGADLVAYWQREGAVGSRPDIADAAAHARSLREQAQRRPRS